MRLVMLGLLALLLCIALGRVCTSRTGYAAQDRAAVAAPADRMHLAGTDELGRDRAVRLAVALLLGMAGACAASAVSSAVAVALGGLAGFSPGWLGRCLLFGGDLFLTLPWLFLLMLVRSSLPLNLAPWISGLLTFSLLALLGAPTFLRLNYERCFALKRADWMFHGHASGLRRMQLGQHVLPHLKPVLLTQFLLYVPACLMAEANLGTLGLGLGEPLPSLGNFLANLQSAALIGSSNLVYLPAAVLIFVLVAIELSIFGAES